MQKFLIDTGAKRREIIPDTRFEFGALNDKIILIDEILTPDSSRFWDKESYRPGKAELSFDKQFVRDYLESLNWCKKLPAQNYPKKLSQRQEKNTTRHTTNSSKIREINTEIALSGAILPKWKYISNTTNMRMGNILPKEWEL